MRQAGAVLALLAAVAFLGDASAAGNRKIREHGSDESGAVEGIFEYGTAEIIPYNLGVEKLDDGDYAGAQRLFEAALRTNEKFPEAHNNLAFSLRMQGLENAEESLEHYARAIELAPELAQAYVYRGTLYVQLGREKDAEKDLEALEKIGTDEANDYAKQLARMMKRGKSRGAQDALGIYGLLSR